MQLTVSTDKLQEVFGVSLYRNAVFLMVNLVITGLASFVFLTVAAQKYCEADIGLASAAISLAMLLSLCASLGLNFGIMRFLSSAGGQGKDMINSAFTLQAIVCIGVSLAFLVGLSLWPTPTNLDFLLGNSLYAITFVTFSTTFASHNLAIQVFVAERSAGYALAQGIVFAILRFVPLIYLQLSSNAISIFSAWGIGSAVAVAIALLIFLPRVRTGYYLLPTLHWQVIRNIIRYAFSNYLVEALWTSPNFILPIIVLSVLGPESNGFFYIGWAIGSMLFMIPMATSASLLAESSHEEENLTPNIGKSLKLLAFLLTPAVIIMCLAGDKILLLIGDTYSENSAMLLRILAISAIPVSLNYLYFGVRRVEKAMNGILLLAAFVLIATLVLSYILISMPEFGILGGGLAWLISQTIAAIFSSVALLRRRPQRL